MSARAAGRLLRSCALAAGLLGCASGQDPTLRTVVVHYEARRVDELAAEGLRVDWHSVSGNLRVGNVVPTNWLAAVSARPEASQDRESGDEQGTFGILEGRTGRLSTSVGARPAMRALTPYGARVESGAAQVGSGFDVMPHVLANGSVRLDFSPFDARLDPRASDESGDPVVEHNAAATMVMAPPGAKVAVGGLARDSTAGAGRSFSGFGTATAREERVLVVWVEVEAPED